MSLKFIKNKEDNKKRRYTCMVYLNFFIEKINDLCLLSEQFDKCKQLIDSAGRRHTSFASVEVMPEFEDVGEVVLKDEDLDITAHRSSGAGGQHINKTDSAIRIVHKPTGIVVGCQTERSQLQNKETALKMLKAKLMEIKLRENLEKIEDIQGNKANIEWGNQIRSYVFMPYTLAKDTRTGFEDGNIDSVMDGNIDGFINAYLKQLSKEEDK